MNIGLAFVLNESQVIIKSLNEKDNSVKDKKIDIISLPDEEIDSIYFSETIIENSSIANIIEKEQKFIPTHTFESLEIQIYCAAPQCIILAFVTDADLHHRP